MTARSLVMSGAGSISGPVQPTYSDDVFKTILYTSTSGTRNINADVSLVSSPSWHVGTIGSTQNSVATDSSGNYYVTGSATDSADYILTAKYDSSGAMQWQRRLIGSPQLTQGRAICVDGSGNVYIAGRAGNSVIVGFVAKYNNSGVIQWQRFVDGTNLVCHSIAISSAGDLYVGGNNPESPTAHAFLLKYDNNGVIQWKKKIVEISGGSCYGIATDSTGNVYAVGSTNDAVSSAYILTVKFDSTGALQWQRKLKQNSSIGYGIAVDSSSNVYIVGNITNTATQIITAKYDTSGTLQWQRKLTQGANNALGYSIAVDSSGNVYIAGYAPTQVGSIIAKYNTSGVIQWQKLFTTSNGAFGVAWHSSGYVVAVGAGFGFMLKMDQAGNASGLAGTAVYSTYFQLANNTATDAAGTATASTSAAIDSASTTILDSAGNLTDSLNLATYNLDQQEEVLSSGGLVWLKSRSNGSGVHGLYDTARGATFQLSSSATTGQTTNASGLTAFYSGGFTVGSSYNISSHAQVAWVFRKAPKFFDVVTFSTDGSGAGTFSHSLGSLPGCVFIKRTGGVESWYVYHRSLTNPNNYYLNLETTGAETNVGFSWITVTGNSCSINGLFAVSSTYVAYLFAHDTATDGIIQCGSYTGTGATGNAVTLGWEPQYVLVKAAANGSAASQNWLVFDTMRGMPVGQGDSYLMPNSSSAESTNNNYIDPTATGFTLTSGFLGTNELNTPYIYLAIRRPNKPPTIGSSVFRPIAYTGTNASNRFVTTGITTDMVLVRQRTDAVLTGAVVGDRLRGQPYLLTGSTAAEVTSATALDQQLVSSTEYGNAFSAIDGFYVGADATAKLNVNTAASNHIANAFKRAPGVFDVVCYTGVGTTGASVAHQLGVAPELMIIKQRGGTTIPYVYVSSLGNTNYLELSSTAAVNGPGGVFGNTTPTASNFYVSSSANSGGTGLLYVAYLFATSPGISKVFSYTGNGTSQTINCGFTTGARFVLIKRTNSTGDWYVWDTARGIVAGNDPHMSLNTTAAEVTTDDSIDADGTGFIVNQLAATNINVTSATYIGLAFA